MSILPNAQLSVSRRQFGFNNSQSYSNAFTGNGLNDSLSVGVPNSDSAQIFDLRSIYYTYSCPSAWSEDTTTVEAKQRFAGANEI